MLKALLFDIGDTIVDTSGWKNDLYTALSDYMSEAHGIDKAKLDSAFRAATSEMRTERSRNRHVDKIGFMGRSLAEKLGLDPEVEKAIESFVKDFRKSHQRLFDDSKALLSATSKNYDLYAVTHARVENINDIMDRFSLHGLFKDVIISERSGAMKDDGGLFRVFLEKTGLNPKDCLMVGNDAKRDGKSLQFGIPFCFVDRNGDGSHEPYTFRIGNLGELDNVLRFFSKEIRRSCYFCKADIANALVCEKCKEAYRKKIMSDPRSMGVVGELASFTNLSHEHTMGKLMVGPLLVREDWLKAWPTTEQEIADFYSKNANYLFDLTVANMQNDWVSQNNAIVEYAKSKGYEEILDFGCGTAEASLQLAKAGKKVSCVDLSETNLKYVKSRFSSRKLEVQVSREIDDRQYDFVICTDVLEHLTKPVDAMRTLISHIKKNGTIAFTTRFFDKDDHLHPMHLAANAASKDIISKELIGNGFSRDTTVASCRGLEIWTKERE